MNAGHAVNRPQIDSAGLTPQPERRGKRTTLASALDRVRVSLRWWLQQRRPRPAWGDHAIDYAISAAQTLVLIALLVAIGG